VNIRIRPAQTDDTPAINDLLSQIVQVHYKIRPDIFRPQCKNESEDSSVQESDAPLIFVAVNEDGGVVGCLWCFISEEKDNSLKIDRNWLCIDDICVDEKYRRCGIGRQLVEYAFQIAQEKGLDRIQLNVYDDNKDAVRFYENIGFTTQKRVMEISISAHKQPNDFNNDERRARIYPIILSEYNPAWPEWYTEEKANLERLIDADSIVSINHIGSTAVPGLMAKPTVDIILEINETTDLDKLAATLPSPEYICLSGAGLTIPTLPPHLRFIKGYLTNGFAEKVYHIHLRYPGDNDSRDKILFRDYLIAHPEAADEYTRLKRNLFNEYEHNRDGYIEAKSAFVQEIIKKGRKEVTQ
jgi:GrpB-like predicted nucleotidyltransferase (UPF0157 family)/ribosomal protein S18 acetylase RimI-like enzyme